MGAVRFDLNTLQIHRQIFSRTNPSLLIISLTHLHARISALELELL